jgi:hypothetical protein
MELRVWVWVLRVPWVREFIGGKLRVLVVRGVHRSWGRVNLEGGSGR